MLDLRGDFRCFPEVAAKVWARKGEAAVKRLREVLDIEQPAAVPPEALERVKMLRLVEEASSLRVDSDRDELRVRPEPSVERGWWRRRWRRCLLKEERDGSFQAGMVIRDVDVRGRGRPGGVGIAELMCDSIFI